MMNVQEFIAAYTGKVIAWAECVALFWRFNLDCNEGETYSAPGAYNLWTQQGGPYVWDTYTRVTAAELRYADIAIWDGYSGPYQNGGNGHVALFLSDNGDGTGKFFSQNPGPAAEITLSLAGIVGGLRGRSVDIGAAASTVERVVDADVAMVRTGPSTDYALAPAFPEGIAKGARLAVTGYVAGQDPYGTGDNAWYVTKSGFYVWANGAGNDLSGLPQL